MPFHSCASSLPYFSAHLINGSADIRTQQKDGWQFHRKNTAGWWSCVLRVQQSERSRQWEETTRPQREKKKNNNRQSGHFHSSESLTPLWGNRVHWFRWGKMAAAHSGISHGEKPKKKKKNCLYTQPPPEGELCWVYNLTPCFFCAGDYSELE